MENKNINQETKFTYDSEEEYLISRSIEQVKFADFQISRQLESVNARIKDLKFEVKLFIGILMGTIIIGNLFFAMVISGGAFTVIGLFLSRICSTLYLVILPVCLYKILKAMIILSTNKKNDKGSWAARAFSITAFSTEIKECQVYKELYRSILNDLESWKNNLEENIPVDKKMIEDRMKDINLDPKIPVTFYNSRKLKRFSMFIAIVVSFILLKIF